MSEPKYIPDAKGTVLITGLEEEGSDFRTEKIYVDKANKTVKAGKKRWQDLLKEVVQEAGAKVKRIQIRCKDMGTYIQVLAPDVSKKGNRPVLSDPTVKRINEAGGLIALGDLRYEVLEVEETVILSGDMNTWFRTWFAEQVKTGKMAADAPGVELVVKQRVTANGFAKLQDYVEACTDAMGVMVAKVLLDVGIKAGSVRVK